MLVVDDVEESRDGIEKLLTADGYQVDAARTEDEAVDRTWRRRPDLILVVPGHRTAQAIASGARIRQRAGVSSSVPVVVFSVPTIEEGAEVAMGNNIYATRPDNFNQLRRFLARLLAER